MSLITVWLQVRVLPGLPAFASFGSTSPCHEHRAKRTEDVVRQTWWFAEFIGRKREMKYDREFVYIASLLHARQAAA